MNLFAGIGNVLSLLLYVVPATNVSLSDLFRMTDEEVELIEFQQKYVDVNKERIEALKKYRDTLIQHANSYVTEEEFVYNPLAIYKTVKHLTIDFEEVKNAMVENRYEETVRKAFEERNFPALDDGFLYDAVHHTIRLQRMHNLTAVETMEGSLAPTTNGRALTPEDCFYIAKISAANHDHESAVDWMLACKDEYHDASNQVSNILISSFLMLGNLSLCRETVTKLLSKDKLNRVLVDLKINLSQKLGQWQDLTDQITWNSFNVCAGDHDDELTYRNTKTCRYNHHNSPFLIIAPLKEELISIVPKIILYRDAVYESEIEELKTDSYNALEPSKIRDKNGRTIVEPRFFPSRRAFSPLIKQEYANLRNRLMDMTSLLYNEQGLLILYYVCGGFIRVHSDFLEKTDPNIQSGGHRIAQALLYLSDVTLGGETVFPRLKLKIRPNRGSVLSWTNMRVDGSEEMLVHHAGCPVAFGEKIVGTQWFRMRGQDYWITRPEEKRTLAEPSDDQDIMV